MSDDKKTDGSYDERQKKVLRDQLKKNPKDFKDTYTPPKEKK